VEVRAPQSDFYNLYVQARDRESRVQQADKIAYVLTQLSNQPLSLAICLDLGCSSGVITTLLAPLFSVMIGLDYDEVALRHAERSGANPPTFLKGDAMRLPFADGAVDVVICAQVYEHVPSDVTLVAEAYRVLKPGGLVFFSGPNKLFPVEPHYFLPFLHWLPEGLANTYLRLTGRGEFFYERSRTLWGLRRLFARFVIQDVTVHVLKHKAAAASPNGPTKLLSCVPASMWTLLLPFFPNYNWLLYKPLS